MTRFDLDDQTPQEPNNSRVPLILGVETPLVILSLILWALRMDSRCRPVRKLWWDDFFISLAMLLSIASYVVALLSIEVGYGRHTSYLTPDNLVSYARLAFIAQPLWVWEVTFIKVSVACMFLRLTRTVAWQKTWKFVMYFSIFYLFASAIIVLCFQLTECTPLHFWWDRSVKNGHCRNPKKVRTGIIGTSVVFAFSDFQFSLLPLPFVLRLDRPFRERVAVACIMSLGLLASIIGCLKFIGFNKLHSSPDPTWIMVPWKLGSFAEASIGIIAANIPPLKSRAENLLKPLTRAISSAMSGVGISTKSNKSNESTLFPPGKNESSASESSVSRIQSNEGGCKNGGLEEV